METIYVDRNNKFAKKLYLNNTALTSDQMDAISRVDIVFKGVTYDSATYAAAFDWTTEKANSYIIFALGEISVLPEGHDQKAELIVYTSEDTDGIIWDYIDLTVYDI